MVVLDGEPAVPCNPQSAIAGLNSLLRSTSLDGRGRSGVEGWVLRNGDDAQARQDREVAAVSIYLRVPQVHLTGANWPFFLH